MKSSGKDLKKGDGIYSRFFLFIPDFILISRVLPSQTTTNHPTILLDILCLGKLNYYFFYLYFLGFAKTNHVKINIINLYVVWVVSERKKHFEQMMKVHMVHIIQSAIVLDMIENHDTNYYNKHVNKINLWMSLVWLFFLKKQIKNIW